MSLTPVLSVFLVLAGVQATRILESHGGALQDVEMIGAGGNYVKEHHASDARVRDAVDEIRSNAVHLMKEIDDAAKSGSKWEFCYEGGICVGDKPKCCLLITSHTNKFVHRCVYESVYC
ncbi:unnamed protein product [Symbiodinium sp. CCMP2592]|nr:unnamed protein product [Symbiodinium sp. CCMP2592]